MENWIIDSIFRNFSDNEYLMRIARMETNSSMKFEDEYNEMLRRIMEPIESNEECYQYFCSMKNNPNYLYIYVMFMCQSSRVEDIKMLIDEREKLKIDSSIQLINLIIGTKDKKYIEDWIENKRDELYEEGISLTPLIEAMGEEFIKDCIERRQEELELTYDEMLYLIKKMQPSYIENVIDYGIEGFEFYYEDIIDLIKLTSIEYKKKCLEQRRDEFEFSHIDIMSIIKSTNEEFICDCLQRKIQVFDININDVIQLISLAKDKRSAREYVDRFYNGIKTKYDSEATIDLPDTMTIGTEIESEGKLSDTIRRMSNILEVGCICKRG